MITMTDIVRRRYETGAYGSAHFCLPSSTLDQLRATTPPPPTPTWRPPDPMAALLSIPFVIDESVTAGQWTLVDNATDAVIAFGTLDAP